MTNKPNENKPRKLTREQKRWFKPKPTWSQGDSAYHCALPKRQQRKLGLLPPVGHI
jgi:hypothetical protein